MFEVLLREFEEATRRKSSPRDRGRILKVILFGRNARGRPGGRSGRRLQIGLRSDGGTTKLNFDDWFRRLDDRVMVARGLGGRLGLPFAVAHVTYRRFD